MKTDERLFHKFGRLYPNGSYLFREGSTGKDMFYILDGKIRVEKKAGHVSKVLAEIGSGSYLGEMAALIDSPRTASAYAVRDSDVAVIPGDMLRDVLRESEGVSLFMLREFSHRIKHTNDDLERITQEWIKFFIVLYFLKEWPASDNINYAEELAGLTGKTSEEIEDVFKWLCERNVIFFKDGRVTSFARERVWDLLNDQITCQDNS
ncbi:MAG: cyclic nucleotide-binding domain-containing protein [Syntrophales bacterium LBB04]|nr:cyclic nucleotide-binding domain-containing protein [Syntrophales bacterium LBB04]